MLSTEIKINGVMIGYLYAQNMGPVVGGMAAVEGQKDICRYDCTYHQLDNSVGAVSFSLTHKRSEGAVRLVQMALKCADDHYKLKRSNKNS